jgi:hypothetical protein
MCSPQPDQVILLQVEQLTGEHIRTSITIVQSFADNPGVIINFDQ